MIFKFKSSVGGLKLILCIPNAQNMKIHECHIPIYPHFISHFDAICLQEMKEAHEADDNDVVVVKETKMDEDPTEVTKTLTRRESEHMIGVSKRKGHHRPLARTQSSPLVTFSMPPQTQELGPVKYKFTTGENQKYNIEMKQHVVLFCK